MNQYLVFLEKQVETQHNSIQMYELANKKVWLKKASKRHSPWLYLPLRWLSHYFGLSMLSPIPNLGGKHAIACELNRLHTLNQFGISVPRVLAQRPDSFLIADAAQDDLMSMQLSSALKHQPNSACRLKLFKIAIEALQNVHDQGQYLSEAFARNILLDGSNHICFVDFETDPGCVLSLHDCQIRDWLCFIFSTAVCFNQDEIDQVSFLLLHALKSQPDICRAIHLVSQKFQWILKFKPERFGNDGIRMTKCIHLLNELGEHFEKERLLS